MKRGVKRDFFEVFRRLPEKESVRAWSTRRAPVSTGGSGPQGDRGAQTAPIGRVSFSLRHESLIVVAVLLVGLLVGAYVLGYSIGRRSIGTAPEQALSVVAQQPLAAPAKKPTVFYTLQVMKDLTWQSAQQIAADLRAMGYDAFTVQARNTWTVNVGRYADYRTAEARKLKEQISSIVYKGRRWFVACSWQRVTE